jgi:Pyruvate/2-oxoacid:ferredoxin oxidoreductase delta subunit
MSAPADETIISLLQELFEPQEAELALSLAFSPLDAGEIARRAGLSEEDTLVLLEKMANKGVIYSVRSQSATRYALMPPMPGFFEFSLMRGEETPRTIKMGSLWENYFTKALGNAMHGTSVRMSRVIPLNQSIGYGMEIFPYEHTVELVRNSERVALGQCQCRFSARKCHAPLDVCIMLNNWADFTITREIAAEISEEEAFQALIRARDAGLVHTTTNTKGPVPYICNCCPCCCYMLRGVVELKRDTLASSRFQASVDEALCTGCGQCLEACPFDALESHEEGSIEVTAAQCYGCGLCTSVCPADAISMTIRKESAVPYDSGKTLLLDIAKDKQASKPTLDR